jgi:RNA polymerase sigma factor (sigma-70 family)
VGADLAEEVAQMALVVLHTRYQNVQDEVELTKLALTIAKFKILEVRRQPRDTSLDKEDGTELSIADGRPSPYDAVLLQEVKAAIPKLGADCRTILKLKLQGHEYDEMAKILKRSKDSLYVQSLRCHRQLRTLLTSCKKAGSR